MMVWSSYSASSTCISNSHTFFNKIAVYKSQLFASLKGKAKAVLEVGIGTGTNLKYYGGDNSVSVFAIDPNRKMEKFARAAALNAGLPPANFKFIQAVILFFPYALLTLNLALIQNMIFSSQKLYSQRHVFCIFVEKPH